MSKTRQALQRNTDGRYYTIVDYSVKRKYPRVYLKTKAERQARRRLAALDGIDDSDHARKIVEYLNASVNERDERARIAKVLQAQGDVEIAEAFDEYARSLGRAPTGSDVREFYVKHRSDERSQRTQAARLDPTTLSVHWMDDNGIARSKLVDKDSYDPRSDKFYETGGSTIFHKGEIILQRNLSGKIIAPTGIQERQDDSPTKEKLSDCLAVWSEYQRLDAKTDDHIKDYSRIFNAFVAFVEQDLPINRLSKKLFVGYERHVKTIQGERSNKWYNDQFTPVAAILKFARRKLDCDFPDGLRDWIEFDKKKHTSAKSNREPMPVEVFRDLLSKAEEWSMMDVDVYLSSLDIKGKNPNLILAGKKKQAIAMKRAGVVWSAVLRICCNAGCNSVDIGRMEWREHLATLDSDFPYLDFPRGKMKRTTGGVIERMTPLLPSTVTALKRLREMRQTETALHRHLVFANDAKRPFQGDHLSRGFDRLRTAIGNGNGWSLKIFATSALRLASAPSGPRTNVTHFSATL